MLEIRISGSPTNLPPESVLDDYGIGVNDLDDAGSNKAVYVPLTIVVEPKGEIGFSMGQGAYYWPPAVGPHYISVGDCYMEGLGMVGVGDADAGFHVAASTASQRSSLRALTSTAFFTPSMSCEKPGMVVSSGLTLCWRCDSAA